MGALAISQLSSQSTVNRWREAKSREPTEFMSPSHEREYSLLGEHCSVVRLNEGSILDQRAIAGRVRLGERLQPSGFA
jgi:hypothetical protein